MGHCNCCIAGLLILLICEQLLLLISSLMLSREQVSVVPCTGERTSTCLQGHDKWAPPKSPCRSVGGVCLQEVQRRDGKKKSWVFLRSSQFRRSMKTQAAIFWGLSLPPMGPMTHALGYLQRSSLSAPPEDKHPKQTCKGLSGEPVCHDTAGKSKFSHQGPRR